VIGAARAYPGARTVSGIYDADAAWCFASFLPSVRGPEAAIGASRRRTIAQFRPNNGRRPSSSSACAMNSRETSPADSVAAAAGGNRTTIGHDTGCP
jgi:hypothetical protein